MIRRAIAAVAVVAVLSAAACSADGIQDASVGERASHNQLYVVSADPVMIDKEAGWVNIKVAIRSELGTDSVAFNLILR